jgi:3D (Asp-Asp-Asp) domain-containing protein
MKAIVGRSAIIVSVLLLGLISFSAETSIAETLFSPFQSQQQDRRSEGIIEKSVSGAVSTLDAVSSKLVGTIRESRDSLLPAVHYVATAYSLRGKTASGRMVSKGLIAADPRVLPLGSRVRLEADGYSGEYLVADTGGMIKGRRIDIWIPSSREAMRFGRRTVKLTVLSYPPKRAKRLAKA